MHLVKIEYQFQSAVNRFQIKAHGNSKEENTPYKRTRPSTTKYLEDKDRQPRHLFDEASERVGGISKCNSVGALPRNPRQVYYNQSKKKGITSSSCVPDPYMNLVLICKEQKKNPETQFVREVTLAPQPVSFLFNKQQMKDLIKFCTNPVKFSIFQIDPTFDLGHFSVTTTTYEHLLLIDRKTKKHPSLLGPMFIHQKKDKNTYRSFTECIAQEVPKFRDLCFFGTDGETALIDAMKESAPNAGNLRCFLHFQRNLCQKMKTLGIDSFAQKTILADVLGQRDGAVFEEGLVDSRDDLFDVKLQSLEAAWVTNFGKKGTFNLLNC